MPNIAGNYSKIAQKIKYRYNKIKVAKKKILNDRYLKIKVAKKTFEKLKSITKIKDFKKFLLIQYSYNNNQGCLEKKALKLNKGT